MDSGIPLPRVIPDVGPGGRYVTNQLAQAQLQQQQLANQRAQNLLPFAVPTELAGAMSKMAFANMGPYDTLQKMVGDERYANAMNATPEGRAKYAQQVQQLANIPANPYGQFGQLINNALQQSQQQTQPSLGNQLLGRIGQMIGLNRQPMQQSSSYMPPSNALSIPSMPQDNTGDVNALNQSGVTPSAPIPTSPSAPSHPENITPEPQGGPGYQPNVATQGIQGQATAQAMGTLTADEQDKVNQENQKVSADALANKQIIRNGIYGLNNSVLPGAYEKYVPGFITSTSAPLKQLDDAYSSVGNIQLKEQLGGRLTNTDVQYFKNVPTSSSPIEYQKHFWNVMDALTDRSLTKPTFDVLSQRYNNTPAQTQVLWNAFGQMKPLTSGKTNDVNKENVTDFKDILLNDKIRKGILDGSINPAKSALHKGKLWELQPSGKWRAVYAYK